MAGKVYFVGAGPGKADLITVRGLEVLRQADVIVYDYLVNKELLEEAKPNADLICCGKLAKKGRYSEGFLIHQEKIHSIVVKKAKDGKKVIRLKNGDPAMFSRLSEELKALVKNRINFEIIPGVTAASAASAYSGIPLTDRKYTSSCIFVTGHEDSGKEKSALDWKYLARCGTIVLYMALERLEKIVRELMGAGRQDDTPCALIQDAGLSTQKLIIGTLRNIAGKAKKQRVKPPALIIIGEVVKLGKKFNWLRKNKKILFTGLSKERFFLKDTHVHFPLIKIEPLEDYGEFDAHLKDLTGYDWLVFTSRYGVKYFFERLKTIKLDSRFLKGIQIAAIGNSTKNALLEHGICADLIPKIESSIGLLKEFCVRGPLKNKKIFLPRSGLSDKGLTDGLRKMGAKVTASVAYRNVMLENLPDLELESFNEIMFCSPSGVRSFVRRFGNSIPKKTKITCIGDVTKKEVQRCRLLD